MYKKYNKFILAFFAIMIITTLIIVSNILLNKTSKTKYSQLDNTDKKMLDDLSKIYEEFDKNSDELWNKNYKLNKMPIILIRTNKDKGILKKYAFAINVNEIENSLFSKEISMPKNLNLPKVYRISKFDINMFKTLMPSNFGTLNIDENQIFYFKYYPKMITNPDLYFDFSSFLLHESFHIYNQSKWTYDKVGDGEYIENYPVNKENYSLIGLEFKLLDKCMESKNKNDINKFLKQWTEVRTYRYKKWPQLINETNTEAIEGTARYIEYKYSNLTNGKLTVLATKEKPYHVTFSYAFDCIAGKKGVSPSYLERSIKYETGSALGLIMDKLGISWKNKIEDSPTKNGKTQYEILKDYYKTSYKDINSEEIKQIEDENNYKELLKKGQSIVNIISENNSK
ncbi:hypothetical protein GKD14_04555 [Paeniclostridium sordellii]|nr:hypothetical protein [Paeniclostridium sordellii]MSB58202.1 hypothetical protein [Paeniclostridium sordellii]